jgi:hypothetical protein
MTDNLREIERWEQLRTRAMDRGFIMNVDRHKIRMAPSVLKLLQGTMRQELHFLSLEQAESWMDGYEWMLQHAESLGFNLKAAEKVAYDAWDQNRILRSLSSD